jgi:hypothetical protein
MSLESSELAANLMLSSPQPFGASHLLYLKGIHSATPAIKQSHPSVPPEQFTVAIAPV